MSSTCGGREPPMPRRKRESWCAPPMTAIAKGIEKQSTCGANGTVRAEPSPVSASPHKKGCLVTRFTPNTPSSGRFRSKEKSSGQRAAICDLEGDGDDEAGVEEDADGADSDDDDADDMAARDLLLPRFIGHMLAEDVAAACTCTCSCGGGTCACESFDSAAVLDDENVTGTCTLGNICDSMPNPAACNANAAVRSAGEL